MVKWEYLPPSPPTLVRRFESSISLGLLPSPGGMRKLSRPYSEAETCTWMSHVVRDSTLST